MSSTAVAAPFERTGPGWRYRLESIPLRRLRGFAVASVLVGLAGALSAVNLTGAPGRHAAEGTLVGRAWVVESSGSLGRVTDWYDHPPLGWLLLSGWTTLTGAFDRAPSAVAAGRELALVAHLVALGLVWILARRLGLARWAAMLAVALAGLSPLAVALHRPVTIENLAVPWTLAAFVLACSPRRRLAAVAASGACLGAAVLTHEAMVLLVPMVGWQVARASLPSTRRYALVVAGSLLGLVVGAYVVTAALSSELVAGADHPGLVDGIRSQLALHPPLTPAPLPGTSPFDVDPVTLVALLVAGPLALVAVPRLRPIGAASLVLAVLAVGPIDVRPSLLVVSMPLGAVALAGLADHASHAGLRRREVGRPLLTRPAAGLGAGPPARATARPSRATVAVAGAALAVVVIAGWIDQHDRLLTTDLDEPLDGAEAWIVANVPPDQGLITDDALRVDLVEAGFSADRVAGYHQLALDPDVRPPASRTSGDVDDDHHHLIVVTESLGAAAVESPALDRAVERSVPLAGFGSGEDRVEVRTVVTDGPVSVAGAHDHDRAAAATAGAALARNRQLVLAPGARALLADGDVDERLMTVLVALAADTPLRVSAFPGDPAEAATGAPRRAVVVHVASDAEARSVADLLNRQRPPYRPHTVDVGPDRTLTITYRPGAVI